MFEFYTERLIGIKLSGQLDENMAEKLTGWTLAEAIKRPVCEVFNILNSETRKPVASFSDLTTANKTATIEPVRFPFLLLTRDGHAQ